MPFNLLEEAWLPVRRRSGSRQHIAPWEITDRIDDDPIIDLAAPRPDFDGALMQFLIAVVQTAASPQDARAWRQRFDAPPSPQELRTQLDPFRHAFALDGDGPRFAQDLERDETWAQKQISQLLMEQPGAQTIRRNTDLFVKRDQMHVLCAGCAATALFTLQTNAPSGGQGHRTSLRGGGPLTTVLLGSTLWHTVWFNVLDPGTLASLTGNPGKAAPADTFPWLAATRTSENDRATEPTQAHPLQVYWSMPRRIVLEFTHEAANCDGCHRGAELTVRTYRTKNRGVMYQHWLHPLTPHYTARSSPEQLPVHAAGRAVGYRHWLGWIASEDVAGVRAPAAVVRTYLQDPARRERHADSVRAFGYDTDNMKVVGWLDGTLPIFIDTPHHELLEQHGRSLVRAAHHVARALNRALKEAWFARPSDVRGSPGDIEGRFWQETEPTFYAAMREAAVSAPDSVALTAQREQWGWLLQRTAHALFEEYADLGQWDAPDARRTSNAWRTLRQAVGLYNDAFRVVLDLPAGPTATAVSPP